VDFLHFWPSKIHVSPTNIVSSLSLLGATSPLADIVMPPFRVTLPSH
jgi:hypothetical protein